jgi:hypothetical protein
MTTNGLSAKDLRQLRGAARRGRKATAELEQLPAENQALRALT